MNNLTSSQQSVSRKNHQTKRVSLCLVIVSLVWIALDRLTKNYFETHLALGQIAPDNWGLIQFRLVHNTGAAWGMFGHSTSALAMFSVLVCVAVSVYVVVRAKHLTWLQVVGASLVVAGGFGNVIDRFMHGFVIDFLETTFMSFPVFNVADIGVTCGFVLFFLGYILHEISSSKDESSNHLN